MNSESMNRTVNGINLTEYNVARNDRSYDVFAERSFGNTELFESLVAQRDVDQALQEKKIDEATWRKLAFPLHAYIDELMEHSQPDS